MTIRCVLVLCSLLPFAACQEAGKPPPQNPPDAKAVLDDVAKQLAQEGITFDLKAGTVAVKAVVNTPQDPVEYLLIHRKGKRHEAVFVTRSKPSVLNAALMMLGLQPGKNATYVEKNPPPTLEQIQAGEDPIVVTPPNGTPLWFTVRWKTPEGKAVEHCVEDLLLDLGTQKPVANCSWVYLGGRMARMYKNDPEVFVADMEGNLISVCYLSPDNHLATMSHASARDDQNWWTTPLLPPPDTEVEFVFHKAASPLHLEREKRLQKEAADAAKDGKDTKGK
jgi:hypothetical protein